MKKLRLELDDLAVTSFDTEEEQDAVEAQALDPTRRTACPTCRTLCLPYC